MPPPARKRVSLACTSCRKRKRKCDGEKPVCGSCQKESRECEYAHHLEKRKPPTKCYIHALHSRIALLEAQLPPQRGSDDGSMYHSLSSESQSPHSPQMGTFNSNLAQEATPIGLSFGLESRFTSAYGHLSLLQKLNKVPDATHEHVRIMNGSLFMEGFAVQLPPNFQIDLLEASWTWNNNWPMLIHESLFREDLFTNGAKGYCTPALLASVLALSIHNTDIKDLHSSSPNWLEGKETLLAYCRTFALERMEIPTLSFVLFAAILSQTELLLENIASASQHIGIAIRHAMTLGLHIPSPNNNRASLESADICEARSIAWAGIWMLEKHISRILGQPSIVGDLDMLPIIMPTLPKVEYSVWPATERFGISKLTSYCVSNFQLSCELLQMVTPALDMIYSISAPYSVEERENKATQVHVAMSEFYNNLPGPLRLPSTATKQLPPHVYQFGLLYQTLKIMLHRPFIRGNPSMESLHSNRDPHLVHVQSATFSAMRVSYIISSFGKFYPMHRLFPMAVESLMVASHIHLFNSKSEDEQLATRANNLYRLNLHFLDLMRPPGVKRTRAMDVLESLGREFGKPKTQSTQNQNQCLQDGGEQVTNSLRSVTIQKSASIATPAEKQTTSGFGNPQQVLDLSISEESYFDWLDLPIQEHLLFGGAFGDSLWEGS